MGNFYLQLASEPDRRRVLKIIREHSKAEQRIFVGVTDPLDPRVETSDEIRDRVLEAAEYIPLDRLGTTDDCGFAPFSDDTSRSRDVAFAKILLTRSGDGVGRRHAWCQLDGRLEHTCDDPKNRASGY